MAKTNAAEAKKSRKALGTLTTKMQGVDAARRPLGVPLTQDPHAVRDTREKVLEVAIGHEVRAFRKKLGITVADLAAATDISLGMLSKIENGITSPSYASLQGNKFFLLGTPDSQHVSGGFRHIMVPLTSSGRKRVIAN